MGPKLGRALGGPAAACRSQCERIRDAAGRCREIRTYRNYARRPLTSVVEILWSVAYTLPPYWPEALFLVAILVWKWRISLWLFLASVTLGTFVAVMAVQWITELTTSTPKVPPCTYSVVYLQCGEAWAFAFGWASTLAHVAKLVLATKLLAVFLDALTEHRVSSIFGAGGGQPDDGNLTVTTTWSDPTSRAQMVSVAQRDPTTTTTTSSAGFYSSTFVGRSSVLPVEVDLISPAVLVVVCASALLVDYEERKILTVLSSVSNFVALICMLALFMSSPETASATRPTPAVGGSRYPGARYKPPLFLLHSDGSYGSAFSKILKLTAIFASLMTVPLIPNRPGHFAKFMPRAALLVAFLNMALVHTQIIAAGFTGYMAHFQGNNVTGNEFYFLGSPSDESLARRVLFFLTCGAASLGIVFSAPLLQTPVIHSTVTMAKDGLLPAALARDSRLPLVVAEYCLCAVLAVLFDAEAVASLAAVAAMCQVAAAAYCCLRIRLGAVTKLVSSAEYWQNSRGPSVAYSPSRNDVSAGKVGKLNKRYQETIKTLKRGMETLPHTVMAAAARGFNGTSAEQNKEERRHFARHDSVQSVSAAVDDAEAGTNDGGDADKPDKFRKSAERELRQLETAVQEYELQRRDVAAAGSSRHHQHEPSTSGGSARHRRRVGRMDGSQIGLSYSCSVTILAAGSAIFAVLLNLAVRLEASGLAVVDGLFFVFVLLPNLCGMARLRRNPPPHPDSYRVPSLGLSATCTMALVKTLAVRGCMDHYAAVSVWAVAGAAAYVFYGSRNSLAALRRLEMTGGGRGRGDVVGDGGTSVEALTTTTTSATATAAADNDQFYDVRSEASAGNQHQPPFVELAGGEDAAVVAAAEDGATPTGVVVTDVQLEALDAGGGLEPAVATPPAVGGDGVAESDAVSVLGTSDVVATSSAVL